MIGANPYTSMKKMIKASSPCTTMKKMIEASNTWNWHSYYVSYSDVRDVAMFSPRSDKNNE